MQETLFDQIIAINYWDRPVPPQGYLRQSYLDQLLAHLGSHLLKVLLGQRRCGKSSILKQLIAALYDSGVCKHNILYLNFELHELQYIQSDTQLAAIIQHYFCRYQPKGTTYLIFDEIQEVQNWEKIVNSYLADDRYDVEIFLSGSNAHLLSTELSTFVTGRYIEIPIYPFSYDEYVNYLGNEINKQSFINYISDSGFPEMFKLKDKKIKSSYLLSLKSSILLNDIVKRFNIKNPKLLSLLLDFLIDNIGHLCSFNSIVKKLKGCNLSINVNTVSNYINYLEMTYLVHGVSRYDLKGKRILEGERKYFLNDMAFSNYFKSSFDNNINNTLENFVFLSLIQAGYVVHVGTLYRIEIDFIAEKNNQTIYIQVAYLLHDQATIEREFGNLEKINDNWDKWVVSLDDIILPAKNGIKHIQAWDLPKLLSKLE